MHLVYRRSKKRTTHVFIPAASPWSVHPSSKMISAATAGATMARSTCLTRRAQESFTACASSPYPLSTSPAPRGRAAVAGAGASSAAAPPPLWYTVRANLGTVRLCFRSDRKWSVWGCKTGNLRGHSAGFDFRRDIPNSYNSR